MAAVMVAPPVGEAPAPPVTTCLGCRVVIPAGTAWCSQSCRNLDDRHDDGRDDWEPGWDE